jgi:hypothetical protein
LAWRAKRQETEVRADEPLFIATSITIVLAAIQNNPLLDPYVGDTSDRLRYGSGSAICYEILL